MASKYRLADYDSEEEREKDPQGPPRQNLMAAGNYTKRLLDANEIKWAVMGGFALMCRGSRRDTFDVDIVTATKMSTLWKVIGPQPRLIIPDTKLIEGILKIFVRTGPAQGDVFCTEERNIEVDLVMPGTKGAPVNLFEHLVDLEVTVTA